MISLQDFQVEYLDYAARQRLWMSLEVPSSHGAFNELLLNIIDGEERILESFGLPRTLDNSSLLQIATIDPDFSLEQVDELYDELRERPNCYLSGSV